MEIKELTGDKLALLKELYPEGDGTMIHSCTAGYMGRGFVDDMSKPGSALIWIADFCYLAGTAHEDMVRFLKDLGQGRMLLLVAEDPAWNNKIEHIFSKSFTRILRYAFHRNRKDLDRQYLSTLTSLPDDTYQLCRIDTELYHSAMKETWSRDLCGQFKDAVDYEKRGIGMAVLHRGQLVCGASSYVVFPGGIEIEIDTRPDYRRKGLACACSAALIIQCLDQGLYPGWDAHNQASASLAKKLGYKEKQPYLAYEINLT